jgi:gliding motility-associated-like protein
MRRILFVLLLIISGYKGAAQTCDSIIMPARLDLCKGTVVVLPATLSGTGIIDSIRWTPASNVTDPKILNPTITSTIPGIYSITVNFKPNEIVLNGNFSGGNSDFTSDYTYGTPPTLSIGGYGVVTDPSAFTSETWTSFGDHTTGTGYMMAIDGETAAGKNFWCQTLPVSQFTNYSFSIWIAQIIQPVPTIELRINSTLVGTFLPLTSDPIGRWVQYTATWNSGPATSATLCLTDVVYASFGNDFAIDDISFIQHCVAKDDIYVDVHDMPTVNAGYDQTIPAGNQAWLSAKGNGVATYAWTPSESLSCADCYNPVASMTVNTTYTVTGTSIYGCKAVDEVTIHLTCDNNQLFVPNCFTPNGDGENEVFYVRGTGIKEIAHFRVFNRWGEQVFSSQNVQANDPKGGWDGKHRGKDPRPDVYVWLVEAICYTGEPMFIKGDVTLIR